MPTNIWSFAIVTHFFKELTNLTIEQREVNIGKGIQKMNRGSC